MDRPSGMDDDGWLISIDRCPSPNANDRPAGVPVSLVVIHNISLPPGDFGGPYIEALFTNRLDPEIHPYFETIAALKVSAHFLIRRDGQIIQFVSLHKRAWHAGLSSFQGRDNCNDFSVGIELEGADETPYEDQQYSSLAWLVSCLKTLMPDIGSNIAGHSDISPGRKTDPGSAFDWARLEGLLDRSTH